MSGTTSRGGPRGGTAIEGRGAGVAERGEIVDEIAQEEQVNEIAEAAVLAVCGSFGDGVDLLGDLKPQRQARDLPRPGQKEVLEFDRGHELDLAVADIGTGDLEADGRPGPGLVLESHVEPGRVRSASNRSPRWKAKSW